MTSQISCVDLVRIFSAQGVEVQALQGLNLEVEAGRADRDRRGVRAPASRRCSRSCPASTPRRRGRRRVAGHDLLAMRGPRANASTGAIPSASSSSRPRATCCPTSRRPRTSRWRSRSPASPRALRAARVDEHARSCSGSTDVRDRAPGRALGGSAAAGRHRGRAGQRTARSLLADEPTGELDEADIRADPRTAARGERTSSGSRSSSSPTTQRCRATCAARSRSATDAPRPRCCAACAPTTTACSSTSPREYAVLDRVGRLQLPQEYLTRLALRDRVRLELESDHVQVHPTSSDEERR